MVRKSKFLKRKGKLQKQRDKEYNCTLNGAMSKRSR